MNSLKPKKRVESIVRCELSLQVAIPVVHLTRKNKSMLSFRWRLREVREGQNKIEEDVCVYLGSCVSYDVYSVARAQPRFMRSLRLA